MSAAVSGRPAGRPAWLRWPARRLGQFAAAGIAVAIGEMLAVSFAGPSIVVPSLPRTWPAPPWWLPLHLPDHVTEALTFTAIVLGAAGAGCGLLAVRRGARPRAGMLLTAGLIVVALFCVLPPAGSSDSLSYAAYGRIAATGHNPYLMTPAQLRASGDPIGRQTTRNWQDQPSLYGPLATLTQWAAALLGGDSIGLVTFWLTVWLALMYAAIAAALHLLLRGQPAARVRAHLLWTLNPLMLWAVMAGAHIDGLAAGLGFLGLVAAGDGTGQSWRRGLLRAAVAGLLIGAAATVKLPFALFGAGLAWAMRRTLPALIVAALTASAVLLAGYLTAGAAALRVLRDNAGLVAMDSLWRVFYGFGARPGWLMTAVTLGCLGLAALLAWRLPPGPGELPGIRPALAVTLAWLLLWPMQRSWYDAMAFCLLAAFPASRLDWLLLARSVPATLDLVTATDGHPASAAELNGQPQRPAGQRPAGPSWLHSVLTEMARLLVPEARLVAVAVAVLLCATAAWDLSQPQPMLVLLPQPLPDPGG